MQCEVCGKIILRKPLKVTIEGAVMVVCGKCSKLGTVYMEKKSPLFSSQRMITRRIAPPKVYKKKDRHEINETLELIDNFNMRIRKARERLNLAHEDLGRKIGEKVSVLKKIEAGKMTPTNQLAKKLEHTLKIKLLHPPSEIRFQLNLSKRPEITLEKIVHLKRKEDENTKNERHLSSKKISK